MLSRVADAIYWCSRYVERAENVARFVDVNLNLLLDSPGGHRPTWEPLVLTTGDMAWFSEHYGDATARNVKQFLTFDKRYPNSILTTLARARENAQTVREIISREMWEELNELFLMVQEAAADANGGDNEFYDRVKLAGIHYQGVTDATLSRGEAWHFARLGRMLERADKTSRILDVKYYVLLPNVKDVGTTIDQAGWAALLNSASALQMYRQKNHVITPAGVAEFLVLDRDFPRSIHYCLAEARHSLNAISGGPTEGFRNAAERGLGRLRADLDYADIESIMSTGLHEYLDRLQLSLNEIGSAIARRFFGATRLTAAPATISAE